MANRRKNVDEFFDGKNHRSHNRAKRGRNTQNHTQENNQNGFRNISSEVDLHELGLPDAKDAVKRAILDGKESSGVCFIHGHSHGTAIQQWMRGGAVRQFLQSKGIIADVWWPDANQTCVSFR